MIRNRNGFTLLELIVVVVILLVIIGTLGGAVTGYSVSDGSRVGVVTKFSNKGIFVKTWEGDLLLGGAGGASVRSHWEFTVSDDKLAEKVKQALDEQSTVELDYHEYFWVFPWQGHTRYFVNGVKPVVHKTATHPNLGLETK